LKELQLDEKYQIINLTSMLRSLASIAAFCLSGSVCH